MSTKNLDAAILEVMKEVDFVKKSRARGLPYTFMSEEDLVSNLRPAMVANGLTPPRPIDIKELSATTYQAKGGATMFKDRYLITFEICHAESGEKCQVVTIGEAADTGDKTAYKAMTGALKYALRQVYGIISGDDPDKHPSIEQETKPQQKPHEAAMEWFRDAASYPELTRRITLVQDQGRLKNQEWMTIQEELNQLIDKRRIEDGGSNQSPERDSQVGEPSAAALAEMGA